MVEVEDVRNLFLTQVNLLFKLFLRAYIHMLELTCYKIQLFISIAHDVIIDITVFDDGDECTLRRSSLCLQGARHFKESQVLQLPAYICVLLL